jgi:hypothetical protein
MGLPVWSNMVFCLLFVVRRWLKGNGRSGSMPDAAIFLLYFYSMRLGETNMPFGESFICLIMLGL